MTSRCKDYMISFILSISSVGIGSTTLDRKHVWSKTYLR